MAAFAVCYEPLLTRSKDPAKSLTTQKTLLITRVTKSTRRGQWQAGTVKTLRNLVLKAIASSKPPNATKPRRPQVNGNRRLDWRNVPPVAIQYRSTKHADLPHVVKFSGGRSSGALLAHTLANNLLDRDRGDVIIFTNTGAEHRVTYEFVHHAKLAAESYGIPFLAVEFCTYEAAQQGTWRRLPTYRLVQTYNPLNGAQAPAEYAWDTIGTPFEAVMSHTLSIPNPNQRDCTKHLKILTSSKAVQDWATGAPATPHQGSASLNPRMTDVDFIERHRVAGGGTPDDILLAKKEFIRSQPWTRPSQHYAEYSPPAATRVTWVGPDHVSLIGLRADEPTRAAKVVNRAEDMDASDRIVGEHPYCPLVDWGMMQHDVKNFWADQTWDLNDADTGPISNCVHCFMKGRKRLAELAKLANNRNAPPSSPENLEWWARMDDTYGRDLIKENRTPQNGKTRIGMFGADTTNRYQELAEGNTDGIQTDAMPCGCTE